MLRSPETVKSSLLGIVSDMAKDISSFVRNPATDFTRDRKLNFKNTVSLILSMGGQSLNSELIDYFQYVEPEIPTASALIQQSDKLSPMRFLTFSITSMTPLKLPAMVSGSLQQMALTSILPATRCWKITTRNPDAQTAVSAPSI